MVMRVRPISAISCTGTSRMRSMSTAPAAPAAVFCSGWKTWAPAGAAAAAGALAGWGAGAEAAVCSARALAQSSMSPPEEVLSVMVALRIAVLVGDHLLHAQCVAFVGDAVAALHHGNAVDAREHGFGQLDRQHVADLQAHQLAEGGVDGHEVGGERHVGALHLLAHLLDPALVDLDLV